MYTKIVVISLLAVAAQHVVHFIYEFYGFGNVYHNHYPGPCKVVQGFNTPGAEDMTVLPSGVVLVTSGLDFASKRKNNTGGVYLFDTQSNDGLVTPVKVIDWPVDQYFEPHGLNHLVNEDGSVDVFIVTHKPEAVAKFRFYGGSLHLTKLYKSPLFKNINSVLPVGPDSFYVTQVLSSEYGDQLAMLPEILLMLPRGSVFYCSEDVCSEAASRLLGSNGITGNNRFIYVAVRGGIQVYIRAPDNSLILQKTLKVNIGSIDNLKVDSEGNIWAGCQTSLAEASAYMDNAGSCGSQVLRISDPEGQYKVESYFSDDGRMINCSSVALYFNGILLVGSFQGEMVKCAVNYLRS